MKKYKLTREFNGSHYLALIRPCIYAWCRGRYCLYVGQGINGISRPFGSHHVINKVEPVQPSDFFLFYWVPDNAPFDHLDFAEECLIKQLLPKYNQQKNPNYEKNPTRHIVRELPEPVSTHETLAEILYREMQELELYGDPRSHTDEAIAKWLKLKRSHRNHEHSFIGQNGPTLLKQAQRMTVRLPNPGEA